MGSSYKPFNYLVITLADSATEMAKSISLELLCLFHVHHPMAIVQKYLQHEPIFLQKERNYRVFWAREFPAVPWMGAHKSK